MAVTIEWNEIMKDKLSEFIPKPKLRAMFNSWVNPTNVARETNDDYQFLPPIRESSSSEVKKCIGDAVANTMGAC